MTGSLQVKSGKYYAVLNFHAQDGRRTQKWINLGLEEKGNKRRAEAELNRLLVEYQGIDCVEPMNTLLSQHISTWLEYNRPSIETTTYDQYVSMLKNHIAPYFDRRRMTLVKLTPGDLEDYYKEKEREGLSPNTVIKHHAVIRSALQWAVKHRYVRENVADYATRPARVRYHAEQPYNVEEIAQLLRLTQNDPIEVPIFLASFYGLRRSEVLGLRWSAIDFVQGTISITSTVVREKRGEKIEVVIREGTTKTETSMRTLPLCQYTYQYFTLLKQRQEYQRALCGANYNPHYLDFICVDPMGTLLQPDYISQRFQLLLDQYGLRHIRYHDLRHSCATIMLYLGYNLKDIQTWLGHSNYNFTADTYLHSTPQAHLQMADAYSQKIQELLPQNPIRKSCS